MTRLLNKLVVLGLGLLLLFPAVGYGADWRVAIVLDVGGLGDQSFNDAAYAGLKRLEEELGAQIRHVESRTPSDYEPNLFMLAREGYDVIWGIGFLLEDAIRKAAMQFPETKFGIIDSGYSPEEYAANLPNVLGVVFKEYEGSFLVGVLAALTTETGVVGYVSGIQNPIMEKFEAGYKAGVWSVDPEVDILCNYTGVFDDPVKGKAAADSMVRMHADVIFQAAGATGLGVIESAEEQGIWAIGVDSDQHHVAPTAVLNSMMKRVDVGVFEGTKTLMEEGFSAHTRELGLAEEGVGLAPEESNNASEEAVLEALRWAEKIASGEFSVPDTPKEVHEMFGK